jgi:hypothetical protein
MNRHKTWLETHFQHNRAPPHFSQHETSTWMTEGLIVVVHRFGYCGPWTSLMYIFMNVVTRKYGIWMQSKQMRGTTSFNFWCWKMHEWPWCSIEGWNHLKLRVSIAPEPLKIGPMFIRHFWLGMISGIRSWSIDKKSLDTLYVHTSNRIYKTKNNYFRLNTNGELVNTQDRNVRHL